MLSDINFKVRDFRVSTMFVWLGMCCCRNQRENEEDKKREELCPLPSGVQGLGMGLRDMRSKKKGNQKVSNWRNGQRIEIYFFQAAAAVVSFWWWCFNWGFSQTIREPLWISGKHVPWNQMCNLSCFLLSSNSDHLISFHFVLLMFTYVFMAFITEDWFRWLVVYSLQLDHMFSLFFLWALDGVLDYCCRCVQNDFIEEGFCFHEAVISISCSISLLGVSL